MKLLGKIFLLLFLAFPLFGKVEAYLEKNVINEGEPAVLVLKANGKDASFPKIDSIEGFEVVSQNSRQSTTIINGKFSQTLERIYTFYPNKEINIPSFAIKIDGKEEFTQTLHIKIKKPNTQNGGQIPFIVDVKVSNPSPYVGELIRVDVFFKRDASKHVAQLQLVDPQFDGFWQKGSKTYEPVMNGKYVIHKASYWLGASKSGKMNLESIIVNVGVKSSRRDVFNMFIDNVSWHRVRSNALELDVKDLPNGVVLVGDMSLKVSVDKNEVEVGKPVNVNVEIRGSGNLDDVPTLDLIVKDSVVFNDKPKVKAHVDKDIYRGVWEQKFALTPSKDTVIEAIKIPFFNPKTKKMQFLQSQPIPLHVKGILPIAKIENSTNVNKIVSIEKTKWDYVIYAFFLGLLFGVLAIFLIQKALHVKPTFKLSKNNKELLKELLFFKGKNARLDNWIDKLEQNCYGETNHDIDKKEIGKILENL